MNIEDDSQAESRGHASQNIANNPFSIQFVIVENFKSASEESGIV
jgi:hypothetical protein